MSETTKEFLYRRNEELHSENSKLREINAELLEALELASAELGINDPQDLVFESDLAGKLRAAIAKAELHS